MTTKSNLRKRIAKRKKINKSREAYFKVLKQNCSKSGQVGKWILPEESYVGIKVTLKFDDGKVFRFWRKEIELVQ